MKLSRKRQIKLNKMYDEGIGTFNHRYILVEELSVGGMCVVYKVQDIYNEYFNDSIELVIKIPLKNLLKKKDIAAFIYSEYRYLREMNHENIVKVYDFGIDYETRVPYIVMEYLEGDLLEKTPLFTLSKNEKISLFSTMLSTVNYIHNQEVIHADISPKNIMLSRDKKVSLFDFGISKSRGISKEFSLDYNQSKAYNPKYSAPEVLEGEAPSITSDMFSLALTLYELFSMELPFKQSSMELKSNPLTYANCSKKIPFLLRKWFVDVLETNSKKRRLKIPILYNHFMF